jgi:5-methylcytosine-specific restriction endonuclease McrA
MPRRNLLLEKQFGRLIVKEAKGINKYGTVLWLCLCSCGNKVIVPTSRLNSGNTLSCGCYRKEKTAFRMQGEISAQRKVLKFGQRFGRLVIIEEKGKNKSRHLMWRCQCDCGNYHNVSGTQLRSGVVQSCGCFRIEQQKKAVTTHGQSQTKEYERVRMSKRRAQKIINGGSHTLEELENQRKLQKNKCYYCGIDLNIIVNHRDHKVPISRGGSNSIKNIVWACAPCNQKKSTKMETEFLDDVGGNNA